MSEIYSRFFSKRSHTKNYRLISFIGIDIYLFINKEIVELLMLLTDETRYCRWVFSSMTFCCRHDYVRNYVKQMSEIYSRFFSKRSHTKNYRLISFIGIDIYLFINKEIVELLMLLTDETRYCRWVFSSMTFCCRHDYVINRQYF